MLTLLRYDAEIDGVSIRAILVTGYFVTSLRAFLSEAIQ
jgi:hypothetical protein